MNIKFRILCAQLAVLLFCIPASALMKTDLEWNINNRTDVQYEVSFFADRLGYKEGFVRIEADGKTIPTLEISDPANNLTHLRFRVPKGTRSLRLVEGAPDKISESGNVDNLFAKASWTADNDAVSVNTEGGKTLVRSEKWKRAYARARVELPREVAGKPAALELNVANVSPQAASFMISLLQYDKDGNLLPEEITDARWISHLRPAHTMSCFRESGFIHPDAAFAEIQVMVDAADKVRFDNYGLPVKDEESVRPCLEVSHLALRSASAIPFPAYDDSFFGEGKSGKKGDCSLALSQKRTFFFATRSMASWAKGFHLRNESQIFFPSAAGTVEAWFKPDWSASQENVVLFDAEHHQSTPNRKGFGPYPAALGDLFIVKYSPASKQIKMSLADNKKHSYSKSATVDIPDGKWFHIAATWVPGGTAKLFVNGSEVLAFDVPELEAVDLKGESFPNDAGPIEFFLGSCNKFGRKLVDGGIKGTFAGNADLLRISTGVRYDRKFKPSAKYGCDEDTRAFFAFDRSFDGLSGGGIGWISGTINAEKDIHLHVIDGKTYYPDKPLPENDPRKVLTYNYNPVLPSEESFAASATVHQATFTVSRNDNKFNVDVATAPTMDYIEYENVSGEPVYYPITVGEGEVDPRSYGDIAESFKGLQDKERVYAIYNYALKSSNVFMNYTGTFDEGSDKPYCVQYSGMNVLNGYCGFECGPLNNFTKDLFAYAGDCPANCTEGYGHTFEEVFYDGMNHTFDIYSRTFFPAMDNENVAGLREMDRQASLLTFWPDAFVRMGHRKYKVQGSYYPEKFGVRLYPGEKFRVWWVNNGESNNLQSDKCVIQRANRKQDYNAVCGADPTGNYGMWRVDRLFPEYGNGFLEYDCRPDKDNPAFFDITDDSFCYHVKGCYTIVAGDYCATLSDGGKAPIEISTDGGKTFRPLECPATYAVRARKAYIIRVCAPISEVESFHAKTEVQVNRRVLTGVLHQGSNPLKFKAEGNGEVKVTMQWREAASPIVFEGAADYGSMPGLERHVTVFDPTKGAMDMKVNGVGGAATLSVKGDIDAAIENGVLSIKSAPCEPHFAWLTVCDGDREQTLTVFVCPGARFVKAYGCIEKPQDSIEYAFEGLPAGKYTILELQRFSAGSDEIAGNQPDLCLCLNAGGKTVTAGAASNMHFDLYGAQYGVPGGRSRWKWDGPTDFYYHQYYGELSVLDLPAFDKISFMFNDKLKSNGPIEVGAVIVIPEPSFETKYDIMRYLFTVNGRPESVK